jgi:hypothetical protein
MDHRKLNHLKHMCHNPQWAAQKIIDQQNEILLLRRQADRFRDAANMMFLFGCQCGPDGPDHNNPCDTCTKLTEAIIMGPGDWEFEMASWQAECRELDREHREDEERWDIEFLDEDEDGTPDED